MIPAIEDDSTLTDRYQTTVPASIRRVLNLGKRDRIHYSVRENGEVVLTRAGETRAEDPVISEFLAFLGRDTLRNPGLIRPVTADTFAEAQRLTKGMVVNLDEALPDDDDE
ncbi:regulator [Halomonas sp. TBZ9]|uniref:Regulator n=1 Tax=Vreelandella azerica TaxID=2732867 RepID=A0A7Y3TXC2_9GAMM|nr:type II toxin-antitoxin system PrlF family antitoxin [Halomonas azerica]NOG31698.1 regulator [Halomonas azerica]